MISYRKDSKIWKRSFARMKKKQSTDYEDEDDEDYSPKAKERSLIGSLINWAIRNPLVFLVYLLIFGHAMYRILTILTNPI